MPQETFSAWDYTRLLKEPMPESRSPEAPAFRQGSSHSRVEDDAMINRRQILLAAAGGGAMMTGISNAQAATYDLLIKGGRVVDPSVGLDAVRDVAIAAGQIMSV